MTEDEKEDLKEHWLDHVSSKARIPEGSVSKGGVDDMKKARNIVSKMFISLYWIVLIIHNIVQGKTSPVVPWLILVNTIVIVFLILDFIDSIIDK